MHHTLGDINVRFVPSCVYAWYARQPFYHSIVDSTPQKFAVHATADPLHLDTNDSKAMHAGRSEAHFIAGMFVNLTPGLSRRLPFRAYHRVRISVCSACSARVCVGCVCVCVCLCAHACFACKSSRCHGRNGRTYGRSRERWCGRNGRNGRTYGEHGGWLHPLVHS